MEQKEIRFIDSKYNELTKYKDLQFVEKKATDKTEFTSEVANANKEAAASKINSREEAIELMKALKQTAAEKPENTLAAHGNVATDAALALLQ